ncbi:MAG TPA: GNAT family N-acetyltransferase [Nocardioides sp.]|uniref:GNAT family N-acetyltransferase n=1 Tax=uncultured Nocardioides sp. TaxID=198441 RepID=UPI000ED3371D|nr:GNAT family N-acetyltransferase [uncultured Nocardioides sp.]HCB03306.1 GNAT family N-acetyltransferase [Nocardioides sp.]HRD60734.1 GNAT family N-acetyltransferase [Nocardioides sp.]HRI96224.1 GNAT family N-acetyltransferase [Nocardioides sp.]HRK45195.1 GNAT family N-acetyltransferase [Nocardioides sp.]
MADHEIKALSMETWPDFEAMVERSSGLFGGCWCVHFHHGVADGRGDDEPNRDFKRRMVEAGIAHAALVYDGADAVAWAEYGTPCELPNIHHRKQYDAESVDPPDYRITCINVTKSHRKQGYGRLALRGAVDLIAQAGGGVVEGYPHDMATRDPAKKMSDSFLYNLTRKTYEDAGFTYVRPKGQQNCVMTMVVKPAS